MHHFPLIGRRFIVGILVFIAAFAADSSRTFAQSSFNMGHDTVPNFVAQPTIRSSKAGSWNSAATWNPARVPNADDRVLIVSDHNVTIDTVDAVARDIGIQDRASLKFATTVATKLSVVTLQVQPGGTLEVGTEQNPIPSGLSAEIMIRDVPLNQTDPAKGIVDPSGFGNGILVLDGKIRMHGAPLSTTFSQTLAEVKAGDTQITFRDTLDGWRAGDVIPLPDTHAQEWWERQPNNGGYKIENYEEVATIKSIAEKTVTLTSPVSKTHRAVRDANGVPEAKYAIHLANISRNLKIYSENPSGTRGHTVYFHRADVDIRFAHFFNLGRTTNDDLNDTTFDDQGAVTAIGTNQKGRYPVHFHHLTGPTRPQSNGYQFTFIGNSVTSDVEPRKWSIAIHNAHYGLLTDNTVYNAVGSGIVFEDGPESFNRLDHNYVARVVGLGQRQQSGREGIGIWMPGPNNWVDNNIVQHIRGGSYSYCFSIDIPVNSKPVQIPKFQGADPHHGDFTVIQLQETPVRSFSNNWCTGAESGFSFYNLFSNSGLILNGPGSVLRDLKIFNVSGWNIFGYWASKVTIDGLVARSDVAKEAGTVNVTFDDYNAHDVTMRNFDMVGRGECISVPISQSDGTFRIEDSTFQCDVAIANRHQWSVSYTSQNLSTKNTIIDNVRFLPLPGRPHLEFATANGAGDKTNIIKLDRVRAYDFGEPGRNFELYHTDQAASAIMPQSTYNGDGTTNLTASPDSGLTNQQNSTKHGIATGGKIATCNTTTIPGIRGIACPLDSSSERPSAPTSLRFHQASSMLLWEAPLLYENGQSLAANTIIAYTVTLKRPNGSSRTYNTSSVAEWKLDDVTAPGTYEVVVRSVLARGPRSNTSTTFKFDIAAGPNATSTIPPTATQTPEPPVSARPTKSSCMNFDGDGLADWALVRDTGKGLEHFVYSSKTKKLRKSARTTRAGLAAYSDYDGDGITDIATIQRTKTKPKWSIRQSSAGRRTVRFASATDTLLSGCDFNGDGKSDISSLSRKGVLTFKGLDTVETSILLPPKFRIKNALSVSCFDLNNDAASELLLANRAESGNRSSSIIAFDVKSGSELQSWAIPFKLEELLNFEVDGTGTRAVGGSKKLSPGSRALSFDTTTKLIVRLPGLEQIAATQIANESGGGVTPGLLLRGQGIFECMLPACKPRLVMSLDTYDYSLATCQRSIAAKTVTLD